MKTLRDGEWTAPLMSGYRLECCNCPAVHKLQFKVVKEGGRSNVLFKSTRIK